MQKFLYVGILDKFLKSLFDNNNNNNNHSMNIKTYHRTITIIHINFIIIGFQCIYISTDEVEMYCHRSRDRYFIVTKPRNYSTTTETTMTKYTLSRKATSLGSNPKKWTF